MQPSPLANMSRFPVSVIVAMIAIAVTLAMWFGVSPGIVTLFVGSDLPVENQPWLLVTTMFPHGNIMHIFFNLSAWWYFARVTEVIWGSARLLGITLLVTIISSGAEIALFHGGVGLSGVVYGLVTMLYVVQKKDPRFAGVVNSGTAKIFAAWFVLCIVLTAFNFMRIANVAHGAGALAGAMIGWAVTSKQPSRQLFLAGIGLLTLLTIAGATVARPFVNIPMHLNSSKE